MHYEILSVQGMQFLHIFDEHQCTQEQMLELFKALGARFGVQGGLTLLPNDKQERLNKTLSDYIAVFESGEVFVNLGCCIFNLRDIQDTDNQESFLILREIMLETCQAQPLLMKKYAKLCVDKKNTALEILKERRLSKVSS